MEAKAPNHNLRFLAGGGEMGELMRNYDWAKTSIGTPGQWPQSLRTTLSIILNSKFPMFLYWGEGLLCFYNDAYRPSMGNEGKHPYALGKSADEVWPEIWHIIKPMIDKVLISGEASFSEDQLVPIYRNGSLEDVYWTFSYSPVCDESGMYTGVFVACIETTKQILATKELLENKNQLQFAIDATELGTFEFNPFTNKLTGNDRMKDWFCLPKQLDLHIDVAINVIAEKDRERVEEAVKQTLTFASGGGYDIEYTIINPVTHVETIIRAKGKTWFNEQNIAYRFNGTLQDVTKYALARQKTEESEERFRAMAEGSPFLIAIGDETSNSIYFNKAWTDFTGRPIKDLINFGWVDLVHPDDRQTYVDIYMVGFTKKKPFQGEFRLLKKNGQYSWWLGKGLPRYRLDGTFAGYISSCVDITEQKVFVRDLENQVQERTKELGKKNKDLENMNIELQSFANVSSHDLQEPLRKIQFFANLIMETESSNLSANGKKYFGKMQHAASRMRTLIEDLLAYSRTNVTDQVFETVNLEDLVQEVCEDMKETFEAKKAKIELHPLFEAKIIPFQFRQLFNNLIGNAIKFSSPERLPVIEIKSSIVNASDLPIPNLTGKNYYHLVVSDNGIGFKPEYSEKIFEIFQRLHLVKDYEGTGIGLAIVKKIVDNHHGFISASSELGKGATFNIFIPIEQTELDLYKTEPAVPIKN